MEYGDYVAALIKFLNMFTEQWPATIILAAVGAWLGALHVRVSRIVKIEANIDALRQENRQQADRHERQIELLRQELGQQAARHERHAEVLREELGQQAAKHERQIEALRKEQQALRQEQEALRKEQADKFDKQTDRLERLVLRSIQPLAAGQFAQSAPPKKKSQL